MEKSFAEQMKEYVERLRRQAKTSKETAAQEAMKALIETGVLNSDGSPKKRIVSWE